MSLNDVAKALKGALGPRTLPAGAVALPPEPPAPAETGVASTAARLIAHVLLGVGLLAAILIHGKHATFEPKQGFILFTGFYVAAQAVERLLEFVLPPGGGTAEAKADRALIVAGLALLLGIALSLALGLRFLSAVQVGTSPRWLDVFITGLVIAGGTKPLHDLIGTIEKAKTTT
jgi:hypothetical protein